MIIDKGEIMQKENLIKLAEALASAGYEIKSLNEISSNYYPEVIELSLIPRSTKAKEKA